MKLAPLSTAVISFALLAIAIKMITVQNNSPLVNATVNFMQHDPVLAQYGAVTADARWDRSVIDVCWLDHPEFASQRAWVQEAIKSTWMKSSGVIFAGWSDCTG